MSRIFPPAQLALILAVVLTGSAFAGTYYIAANGSDSNNGTSKTTPWAHLPGMATWTGSHTPVAGDTFILRGCDVWSNANFSILWSWSGATGNRIQIGGLDKTWYNSTNCPSGWNRPVFNAGNAVMNGTECSGDSRGTNTNSFIYNTGAHNFWSWIELKGLYWASGCGGIADTHAVAGDVIYDNLYVHKWSVNLSTAGDISGFFTIPGGTGACNSNAGAVNCTVQYLVQDNSDSPNGTNPNQRSGGGVMAMNTINSIFSYMTNAIKPYTNGEIGGNNISNVAGGFDGTNHPNCIETIQASGNNTYYFHDNWVHGNYSCQLFTIGNPGEIDYAWNNIFDCSGGGVGNNCPALEQGSGDLHSLFFWNNTIFNANGNYCMTLGSNNAYQKDFQVRNNHCITTNTGGVVFGLNSPSPDSGANAPVTDHNYIESASQAASNGYTSSQPYNYSPTSASSPTVGAGINLTSSWPGAYSTNDTNYACTEQTVNGVVQSVCPARSSVSRPSSAAWDAGAYFFPVGTPNPPTGLAAVVQ
ncbi:exported hypothetical protein [Candidatus Sulfotelmatobacter kueseliae]|uniref:Right handed beta helix domain-containing protein n=1 Tax=Candidatus Sulfotelmatobacter kueseliae TaxID=2042962 RepID=A0A2U3KKJ2_9BACT|nr:exported hypothetical protein [Candidatus Sulfotelmatobacter kueseliae]